VTSVARMTQVWIVFVLSLLFGAAVSTLASQCVQESRQTHNPIEDEVHRKDMVRSLYNGWRGGGVFMRDGYNRLVWLTKNVVQLLKHYKMGTFWQEVARGLFKNLLRAWRRAFSHSRCPQGSHS
jgi:hypothetical protein